VFIHMCAREWLRKKRLSISHAEVRGI